MIAELAPAIQGPIPTRVARLDFAQSLQPQRGCTPQPRVAALRRAPWVSRNTRYFNPNGVAQGCRTPLGFRFSSGHRPRVRRCAATLGCGVKHLRCWNTHTFRPKQRNIKKCKRELTGELPSLTPRVTRDTCYCQTPSSRTTHDWRARGAGTGFLARISHHLDACRSFSAGGSFFRAADGRRGAKQGFEGVWFVECHANEGAAGARVKG